MKSVLITGASTGIGSATVSHFLNSGWKVFGLDKIESGEAPSENYEFIQVDLADPAAIREAINKVRSNLEGSLNALVNNAAVQATGPIAELDIADWDQVMAVNLRAPYLLAKNLLASFAKGHSAIVNVVSVHAIATSADISAYAASKGGLMALTRSMAIEFANLGIRVNAVLPGAIDTQMLRAGLRRGKGDPSRNQKLLEEKILMGRIGKAQEVASAIHFLADKSQSSYITGQSLVVDGGATARLSTE